MDANCQVVFDVGPVYSGRRLLVHSFCKTVIGVFLKRRSFVFFKKDSRWCIHFVRRSAVCLLSKTVVLLVCSFHKTVIGVFFKKRIVGVYI